MSSQSVVQSSVPPFNQGYSTETDVGRKFGNDSLFTASTTPNITQVRDIIIMGDSWINNFVGHDFLLHQSTEEYDAIGSGRRAGQIWLRNTPVLSVERAEYRQEAGSLSNARDAWIPGVQGSGSEAAGVLVGPNANISADYYLVYLEKAMVWWGRLRFSLAKKFRVTYSWGYPSVPDWVRDLSRTKAALECLTTFGATFIAPETQPRLEAQFERDIQFLLTMGGHRPLAGSA